MFSLFSASLSRCGHFRERDGKSSVFYLTCKRVLKKLSTLSYRPHLTTSFRGRFKERFSESGRKGKGLLDISKHRGNNFFLVPLYGVPNATGNTLPL